MNIHFWEYNKIVKDLLIETMECIMYYRR